MNDHILDIIRFVLCVTAAAVTAAVMIRAGDDRIIRVLAAAVGAAVIGFSASLSRLVYLLIGSTIEAAMAVMGVGFILSVGVAIMLLPIAAVIGWAFRRRG